MERTKLSWRDYKSKALKLKSQGLNFPKIYERLGVPEWNGIEYKLESDKGGIKRKSRAAARSGKAASTQTRASNKNISTPPQADTKAANRLVKQINTAGGQADHIAELSRSGNALRDMSEPRRKQYFQRMGSQVGHQPGNIQNLSPQDNLQKNIDYRKFNSYIRQLAKRPNVGKAMFGASAAGVVLGFIPEIDEATGGHINNTINSGFDYLRSLAVQRLKQLANSYASYKPLQGSSNVDYGQ